MRPGVETGGRGQEALWLPATAFLLLMAAGLLLFTSPPGDIEPRRWERETKDRRDFRLRRSLADPGAVLEDDEPQREPLWLLAFTSFVVIGLGLLFVFYTDIPVPALV